MVVTCKDSDEDDTIKEDSYPAAPAVAAAILHYAGIKPRYGDINLISTVAKAMINGTDFPAYSSTGYISKNNRYEYAEAVYYFLKNLTNNFKPDEKVKKTRKTKRKANLWLRAKAS